MSLAELGSRAQRTRHQVWAALSHPRSGARKLRREVYDLTFRAIRGRPLPPTDNDDKTEEWRVADDEFSNELGYGAGVIFVSLLDLTHEYALYFGFWCANNEAKMKHWWPNCDLQKHESPQHLSLRRLKTGHMSRWMTSSRQKSPHAKIPLQGVETV